MEGEAERGRASRRAPGRAGSVTDRAESSKCLRGVYSVQICRVRRTCRICRLFTNMEIGVEESTLLYAPGVPELCRVAVARSHIRAIPFTVNCLHTRYLDPSQIQSHIWHIPHWLIDELEYFALT